MNILITGAAGLLGGALVAALTESGHAVIGLVHRDLDIRSNDGRSIDATAFERTAPLPGEVKWVQGDIRQAGLGLADEIRQSLADQIDLIIHSAALVKFEAEMAELEAVNVDGTRHVSQLIPNARFIHISTAYVCGLKDGPIAEASCDNAGPFGNNYEKTKARGEMILHQIRPDAIIIRPSIIVGEAATGLIRSFDTIYRAFKFIAEGKVRSIFVSNSATLNFVPIDHVVAGICDVVRRIDTAPRFMHLAARKAVPVSRFLALIGNIPGLSSPSFLAENELKNPSIASRLIQPYLVYFRRCPEFVTIALETFSGRAAPVMDDAALMQQFQFCITAGFIRIRTMETASTDIRIVVG